MTKGVSETPTNAGSSKTRSSNAGPSNAGPSNVGVDDAAPATSYWLKEPDPNWKFWWKGAVPAGTLAVLALYTLVIVAYRTEHHVQQRVTEALRQQGLSWVNVKTEGLDVSLSGSPPSLGAARAAQRFAKEAKCNTWLGALPCVSRVREAFQPPASDPKTPAASSVASNVRTSTNANAVAKGFDETAQDPATPAPEGSIVAGAAGEGADTTPAAGLPRFYELKVSVSPVTVRLEGQVPNEASKAALRAAMAKALAAGSNDSTPQLDNQLAVDPGVAEPRWEAATQLAVNMAARCKTGYVALHEGALTVDCETQTAAQRTNLIAAGAEIPPGITVAGLNVLALDEIQQCEEALIKLVGRSQIRFTTNSASLLPTSRPLLREIAHQLQRCPGVVVVEGHTDAQGEREENLTLSLNRARAVVASLIGYGVEASRVRAEGFGPDKPLVSNDTATGRAQNRRIEFRVARSSEFGPKTATSGKALEPSASKPE